MPIPTSPTSSSPSPSPSTWFCDRATYRRLLLLAVPIILQNLITFGVGLADNLMIGRLGEVAISGLYVGNQFQIVLQTLLVGLESSVIIISSQYWGRRDTARIKDVVAIAMRLAICGMAAVAVLALVVPTWLIGLMTPDAAVIASGAQYLRILALSYVFFGVSQTLLAAMRSVEVVRIGLINSLVALLMNITLNYLLIFGNCGFPALGVRGAALATLISRLAEMSVVVFYVWRIDTRLRLRLPDFRRWDRDIFRDLLKYGLPLMGGQIVWAVNNFAQTAIVGQMASPVIAAVSITGMLDRLVGMGVFGLAAAVGILTGKMIGAGELDQVRAWARTMQLLFLSIGMLCGALIYIGHDVFLGFYRLEPGTIAVARSLMAVLSIAIIGRCYQAPCLMGLVKAGGDTSFVFKNDTVFVFLVVLPSAFLALTVFAAPPWVVYACLLSDQVLKCFVAVVKINSFNWMKNLTRP